MSKLALGSEDFPDAATRHLRDAEQLYSAGRFDGTAYLSGYVIECCLKSIIILERGNRTWSGATGHDFVWLHGDAFKAATAAGGKAARYLTVELQRIATAGAITAWRVESRYKAPHMVQTDAGLWLDEARTAHRLTIEAMRLDGEI